MTCFYCKGDMEEATTTYAADNGKSLIVIRRVPCHNYPEKKNIPKNRNKWHRKGKRFREIRDKILDAIWYNYYAGIA